MKLRETLSGLFQEARAQYQRDLRLRRAVLVMGVLLGLFLVDRILLWSAALDGEIAAAEDRYTRTLRAAGQPEWIGRAQAARAGLAAWRDGLWTDASPGLVQARVQNWLEGAMVEAGIPAGRVVVAQAVEVPDAAGVLQVVAEVQGTFEPASFARLLATIEGNPEFLALRRLAISAERRPRFDGSVYLWLTIEEDGDEA